MNRKSLILIIFLGLIILIATAQAIRPTFRGSPAACAWYADTSISNPFSGSSFLAVQGRTTMVYDTLDVFVVSQDHKLLQYHLVPKRENDGYVMTVLPDQLICYSSPAVVQTGPHTIHVFVWSAEARTVNGRQINHLFLAHLKGEGNYWTQTRIEGPEPSYYDTVSTVEDLEGINSNLGIEDAMAPIAASSWGDDRIDLFVPGMAHMNPNWHLTLIFGQPSGSWENIGQPGSQSLGIASGSWGPGRIDVFALCGDDRAYYHKSFVQGALLSDNGRDRVNGWDQDWLPFTQGVRFSSAPYVNQVPLFPGAGGGQGLGFGGRGYMNDSSMITLWGRGYHTDRTMSDLQSYGGWYHISTEAGGTRNGILTRAYDNDLRNYFIPSDNPTAQSRPAGVNYLGDHVTIFARWVDNTLWVLDYDLLCCRSMDYIWQPVQDLPEAERAGLVGLGPLFLTPNRSTSGPITADQPSIIQMKNDTNIPGSDYKNFDLKEADPKLCAQVCMEDPACVACTYVKPGIQGENARCWLKNDVTSPVPDQCCQSGVKERIRAVMS
jgi:hypothetical protein